MSKNNGLGRGLDALFGSVDPGLDALNFKNEEVVRLALDVIETNADQPRRNFDEKALAELAESVRQYGIIQPIVVTKKGSGYMIIAGERRWRAAGLAGLKDIPTLVRTSSELETLEMALIENVQREDLSPLEQARSIQRLHEQFSMSYEQIAGKLAKAYSTVANTVRLLQLPEAMQKALADGQISEGHARTLLSLNSDKAQQDNLFKLILDKHLSVRQAEQYVVGARQGQASAEKTETAVKRTGDQTGETKRLAKRYGVPVSVQFMAKGGKLVLRFKDQAEYDAIIARMMNG